MNRMKPSLRVLVACTVVAAFAASAPAVIVGPGDTATSLNDAAGDLIAVDLANPVVLGPGLYEASDFSYQFTSVNGSIQPLLLTGSGSSYTPVAVGDAIAVGSTGPYSTSTFGGTSLFQLGSTTTVYAGVYWDETPNGNMPVGYLDGSGSTFIRYNGAVAPSVGTAISGGSAGPFSRTYDFAVGVDAIETARYGNDPSARAGSTDGPETVFWTNGYAAPVDGTIYAVDVYIQDSAAQSAKSFELFQLRPTGTANEYDVVASSQSISPGGTNGTTVSFMLDTPFEMQQGDIIGHYGAGLAWTQNSTTADAHNNQYIYYVSPSAPGVSSTITLGVDNTDLDFPLFASVRDYAYGFRLEGVTETIGNGAGQAPSGPDTAGSLLVVMDHDPFTKDGKAKTWQFYNDDVATSGYDLTPVLLRESGGTIEVIGIGATRVGTADGIQQWDFDLSVGTDLVKAGDLFGFYYGDQSGGAARGSVQYVQIGSNNLRIYSVGDGIQITDTFASGGATYNLPRYYSINLTTIPTPSALPAGLAMIALVTARRRR